MKRISSGIHQLVSPFPQFSREQSYELREHAEERRGKRGLAYVMPYFITSRGDNLLVDCGWGTEDSYQALREQLQELAIDIRDIQSLVLTHGHPDHCGLTPRLQTETGCQVYLHERELPFLRRRASSPTGLQDEVTAWAQIHGVSDEDLPPFGHVPWASVGMIEPTRTLKQDDILNVGDFSFEVIWTPGHSPGHVCLYEAQHRIFLSGDHVLPGITPNVSLHPDQDENPLGEYIKSLRRIAHLKVDRMLPAHEWDIDWFQARMEKLVGHHEARLEEMLGILRGGGPRSGADVAKKVAWSTGGYDSFPNWLRWAALGETLAHLRYLAIEGLVIETKSDGRTWFQAV